MPVKMRYCSLLVLCFLCKVCAAQTSQHNLFFNHLATRWDEAMPLGNGMLGALVWQKEGKLRMSLDRADIWDERQAVDLSKFTFADVVKHIRNHDYDTIHKLGDDPYDNIVYPTKLPAAAVEFSIHPLGDVVSNVLDISHALQTVTFINGAVFHSYIHATQPQGFFDFEKISSREEIDSLLPQLIVHNYNSNSNKSEKDNSHAGEGLEKLGYAKGSITKTASSVRYHQPTYGNHYFEVLIQWKRSGSTLAGSWTIANDTAAYLSSLPTGITNNESWVSHIKWWNQFWSKSAVSLPDKLIEKQYYLEQYKLGCVARKGAPAITLQAIWTADNRSLPPWKGDFHNDLNTQLSYWSSYTGNHLAEAETYTDWLWKIKAVNKQYTKQYFGVDGLNVPGVVTLNGYPMGGWIQYSLSPTVVAWCAQHFYWQWKYSMDNNFLSQKAYPYLHEAAVYLENITQLKKGKRFLPLSSSPEFHDNDTTAWYADWTNYDLSLAKFLLRSTAEMSSYLHKETEAAHWQKIQSELPEFDTNETGFTIAPGENQTESHRHMSPFMAIYPLALLDGNQPQDKNIIQNSLRNLQKNGTREWCGYSFSWMACLYARAYESDSAVRQLQIFASNFCSPNSFHLNGDQKGGQYSHYTYRPFTLEGNFAFAQGVHELLLQSRNGYIEVLPAVPSAWKEVSFQNLRTEGAFLVSAVKKDTHYKVTIKSEAGGVLRIRLPFETFIIQGKQKKYKKENGIIEMNTGKGEEIVFINGSSKG